MRKFSCSHDYSGKIQIWNYEMSNDTGTQNTNCECFKNIYAPRDRNFRPIIFTFGIKFISVMALSLTKTIQYCLPQFLLSGVVGGGGSFPKSGLKIVLWIKQPLNFQYYDTVGKIVTKYYLLSSLVCGFLAHFNLHVLIHNDKCVSVCY